MWGSVTGISMGSGGLFPCAESPPDPPVLPGGFHEEPGARRAPAHLCAQGGLAGALQVRAAGRAEPSPGSKPWDKPWDKPNGSCGICRTHPGISSAQAGTANPGQAQPWGLCALNEWRSCRAVCPGFSWMIGSGWDGEDAWFNRNGKNPGLDSQGRKMGNAQRWRMKKIPESDQKP